MMKIIKSKRRDKIKKKVKVLIINGPNFSHLHLRNNKIYGNFNYKQLIENITEYAKIQARKHNLEINIIDFQSNIEGEIINFILDNLNNFDFLIINPAGLTHYSISLADTLEIVKDQNKNIIEVHLSNLFSRDRVHSTTSKIADGVIMGFKENSYLLAIDLIFKILKNKF